MAGPDDPHFREFQDYHPCDGRRSSVAYDPARDTFTELPDTTSTYAEDDETHQYSNGPIQHNNPKLLKSMSSSSANGKRSRSASAEAAPLNDTNEPSPKRIRSELEMQPAKELPTRPQSRGNEGNGQPEVKSVKDLPRISRIPRSAAEDTQNPGESRNNQNSNPVYSRRPDGAPQRERERNGPRENRRRSRSPPHRRNDRERNVYRHRSPPRPQKRDPSRSPSPIRSPRDGPVIRPGGAKGRGRNVLAEQQRLAAEREAKQAQQSGHQHRGVQDVSNQFYNARPEWVKERGRDWRRNESQIRGLRSFNNWIKSCLIHKFSPEDKTVGQEEELGWGEQPKEPEETKPLLVLDIGCGKGGDLRKWQLAPQIIGLYVGLDPANISIKQAIDRYKEMRMARKPIFEARFITQDCFGDWIGNVPIVQEVGIDPNAGSGQIQRWGGGGGFDIVAMMFSMHYAFESEEKVRIMLRNAAGSLKKGGRFVGVVPNSDVLANGIRQWYSEHPDQAPKTDENGNMSPAQPAAQTASGSKEEGEADDNTPSWGNKIYNVRFPPQADAKMILSPDGTFRPPFGWKYTYWMAEAVDVPEFVVPWEAFRAIAEQYGLEQRYRRGFLDIWESETQGNDPVAQELAALGVKMGVTRHAGGELQMSEEEKEAVSFYHAFCFVKV